MKARWIILILIGFVALIGLLGLAWRSAPRLVAISPLADSQQVAVDAPLRLTFTRRLRPEEVSRHLELTPDRQGTTTWEGSTLVFQPSQPWPAGMQVTVRFTAGARAEGFAGLPLLRGESWTFQTRQELLIYLWPAGAGADLYALDPLTGAVIRLTASQNVADFTLSRTKRSIYYSVEPRESSSAILRIGWPGEESEPEVILECPQAACRGATFSPDGSRLAYERTPSPGSGEPGLTQVWLYSLTEGESWRAGDPKHTTLHPAWSAGGWLAFYDNERQGYLVQDAAGGELAFLPNQAGEVGVWSKQGSYFIALEVLVEAPGMVEPRTTTHLFQYELGEDGAFRRTSDLTSKVDLEDASPAFSPDGSALVFARRYLDDARWTHGRQIWKSLPDGSQAAQLTDAPFYNHYDFAWSADGGRLAYVRFNQMLLTDPPELWIIKADGSDPLQLVKGGFAPRWIP